MMLRILRSDTVNIFKSQRTYALSLSLVSSRRSILRTNLGRRHEFLENKIVSFIVCETSLNHKSSLTQSNEEIMNILVIVLSANVYESLSAIL